MGQSSDSSLGNIVSSYCSTEGKLDAECSLKRLIIIIIIKTYLCRMTISVIKTAINMGPALKNLIHMKEIKRLKLEFIYDY